MGGNVNGMYGNTELGSLKQDKHNAMFLRFEEEAKSIFCLLLLYICILLSPV